MTVRMIATQAIRLLFGMLKLPRADTNSCAIFITNLKLPTAACYSLQIVVGALPQWSKNGKIVQRLP